MMCWGDPETIFVPLMRVRAESCSLSSFGWKNAEAARFTIIPGNRILGADRDPGVFIYGKGAVFSFSGVRNVGVIGVSQRLSPACSKIVSQQNYVTAFKKARCAGNHPLAAARH